MSKSMFCEVTLLWPLPTNSNMFILEVEDCARSNGSISSCFYIQRQHWNNFAPMWSHHGGAQSERPWYYFFFKWHRWNERHLPSLFTQIYSYCITPCISLYIAVYICKWGLNRSINKIWKHTMWQLLFLLYNVLGIWKIPFFFRLVFVRSWQPEAGTHSTHC